MTAVFVVSLAGYILSDAVLQQNTLQQAKPNREGEYGQLVNWLPKSAKLAIEYRAKYLFLQNRMNRARKMDQKVDAIYTFADYIKVKDPVGSDTMLISVVTDPQYNNSRRAYKSFARLLLSKTSKHPVTMEELQNITGVGAGKARKFGKPFIELIKKYVDEKEIIRPQDMVVKSVVNKSGNKVFIIQSIDRQMDFEDIARARDLDFDELLTEIEAIVHSGTKLNISYYINQVIDEDKAEDIFLYFKEDAQSDSIEEAMQELGGDYTEEEIRLVRIQFMSEMGN